MSTEAPEQTVASLDSDHETRLRWIHPSERNPREHGIGRVAQQPAVEGCMLDRSARTLGQSAPSCCS